MPTRKTMVEAFRGRALAWLVASSAGSVTAAGERRAMESRRGVGNEDVLVGG